MITDEERCYLYWLGKSVWGGEGAVMEIGPWLGGSTACLAMGMRDSGFDVSKRLKVFDNFLWQEFMGDRAPLPLQPGESFQRFFMENMSPFGDMIETHARTLPDDSGADGIDTSHIPLMEELFHIPLSILFVDGAKSWMGLLHLMKVLNNIMVPGKTLLVFQDYKYWSTFWVPLLMAHLEPFVEPVHNVVDGTTLTFRLIKKIPGMLLDGFESRSERLDAHQALVFLSSAATSLADSGDIAGAAHVSLGKVKFLALQNKLTEAAKVFGEIQNDWPPSSPKWQLERTRDFLRSEKGVKLPRPLAHRFDELLKKTWGRVKRKIRG